YEWRRASTDIIINNESQFYLDVLGFDAALRDTWSPFELLKSGDDGYLVIKAAKKNVLDDASSVPVVNGSALAGQDYLSGVLTTFGKYSLSPSSNGKVVIEIRARMPRGQGVFPAAWLYNESFFNVNPEIDIFEYIGQSPDPDEPGSWLRPVDSSCGQPCIDAYRENYDTYHTQYHNYYKSEKNKLKGLGATSLDNDGNNTNAVYTNPDAGTWWRGATWAGCAIDFSEKFHIYTIEWSADALVWYVDDIEVLRLDETADSGGNLPRVNFVPIDTRSMYLTLNFALGSLNSYIGSPDDYTEMSMDKGELQYIIDYIKVWQ
ncbi:MAG: glycoside hydrolase family 16 protein, partial [Granulosicoccus sp.]|nr:glycoside hydrolase family 16 protein [Granulosicoccus sp.]